MITIVFPTERNDGFAGAAIRVNGTPITELTFPGGDRENLVVNTIQFLNEEDEIEIVTEGQSLDPFRLDSPMNSSITFVKIV